MKRLPILLSALLVACGGGSSAPAPEQMTDAVVQGTLVGLTPGSTLLISNSGTETIALTENSNFLFPTRISEGVAYNVTNVGEPSGLFCTVTNGSGTITHGVERTPPVSVSCSPGATAALHFNVGVTVTGLSAGQSLALTNNRVEAVTATKDGLVIFPTYYYTTGIYSGRKGGYDVAIKTQPAGKTCTLSNERGAVAGNSGNFVNSAAACK